MSIDNAPPEEWDAIKADRFYDNRSFDIKDATCVLPANHREMMRRDRDRRESEWLESAKNHDGPMPRDCEDLMEDNVNMPRHYRVGGEIECIDYIYQQLGSGVRDYILGNVHKYLHRHRFKGQALDDLKKAQWYLNKLIMEEEQGG